MKFKIGQRIRIKAYEGVAKSQLEQKDFSKVPNALAWLREIFADKNNWTKGTMFRGPLGEPTDINGLVCQVCVIGGIFFSSRDSACRADLMDALRTTPEGSRWCGIVRMNDEGGLKAIQKALDQAVIMFPREG